MNAADLIVRNALASRTEKLAKLSAAVRALECKVTHCGYEEKLGIPTGEETCIDIMDYWSDPEHTRIAPEFRARILAGEELCEHCKVLLVLREIEGGAKREFKNKA